MKKLPVTIFIFKRCDTLPLIFNQIRQYKPSKIYLIADAGRNEEENKLVSVARETALSLIDWECEVIKDFAASNKGVYDRIGKGAIKVLEKEFASIFLEDDNYPSLTFFKFCEQMIYKYQHETKIGWVCGTNYLGDASELTSYDYFFTHHLLPCGWASWGSKFSKLYDGDLLTLNKKTISKMKTTYTSYSLFSQELHTIKQAKINLARNPRVVSWDRQMCFSIRSKKMYGIAPCKNLIKNIGVDMHSIHGGTTFDNVMTARFCGISNYELEFPLKFPEKIEINKYFEHETTKLIMYPLKGRIVRHLGRALKRIFLIDPNDNISRVKEKLRRILFWKSK